MKVLYYTSMPFLDIAIEIINVLKKHFDLYVLVEITPGTSHRIGIEKLPGDKVLLDFDEALDEEYFSHLEPYFRGCKSSKLVNNTSDSGFSLSTFSIFRKTWQFIHRINPDVIHMETTSLRSLGVLPFMLSRRKKCFTIHDPVPHLGESDWKVSLPRFLFFSIPYRREYFFYSEYARSLFINENPKNLAPKHSLRMHPYSYYRHFLVNRDIVARHILFFGTISPYKGVDILVKSLPEVFKDFPGERIIIAGKIRDGIHLDNNILEGYKDQIHILDRFVPNDELGRLIQESKFIVCPYIDATQSGVLMTAFAFNKPVIATYVGAFPEYIEQAINGMLVPVNDQDQLASAIKMALKNNYYKTMEENVTAHNRSDSWESNLSIIENAYRS